jgi:DNA-binding transcriptional ArsR family regulator
LGKLEWSLAAKYIKKTPIDTLAERAHFMGMYETGSALIEGGGISLRIVDLLGKYQSPLPIDFLAMQLGSRRESLMEDLSSLEARGVVKINQTDQTAALVASKKPAFPRLAKWLSGAG